MNLTFFTRYRRTLLVCGASLGGICCTAIVYSVVIAPYSVIVTIAPDTQAIPPVSASSSVAAPLQLTIPRLGIDAVIQNVGVDEETGAMSVPDNFSDVGWYREGPKPGEMGSAVITGHRSGRYVSRGVFFALHELVPGDLVLVTTQSGAIETFTVTAVVEYSQDADTTDIFRSQDGVARLNLITCSGPWDATIGLFSKRVVVYTERVDTSVPVE